MIRIILGTYEEKKHTHDILLNRNPLEVIPLMSSIGMEYNPNAMVLWDPTRDLEYWDVEKYMDSIIEDSKLEDYIMFTNCPIMLNWIDDEVAIESVYLVAIPSITSDDGIKFKPFFSINALKNQLHYIGPGEVFNNSNIRFYLDELRNGTDGYDDCEDEDGIGCEYDDIEEAKFELIDVDSVLEDTWEDTYRGD